MSVMDQMFVRVIYSAGNPRIGDQAIAALVDSLLSPRENEDGSWAFNTNLKHLCIDGER